jgi:hypothetical protein
MHYNSRFDIVSVVVITVIVISRNRVWSATTELSKAVSSAAVAAGVKSEATFAAANAAETAAAGGGSIADIPAAACFSHASLEL